MKRSGLLHCAGLDAPRFKLLKQRDQLPFYVSENENVAKWADYSLDQAFRLRLMLDLIGGEASEDKFLAGIGPGSAASLVSNALGYLPEDPLQQTHGADLWIGVLVSELDVGEASPVRFTQWFGGTLTDLAAWVAKAQADHEGRDQPSVRMILANATRAANFVRDRATKLELPVGADCSAVKP